MKRFKVVVWHGEYQSHFYIVDSLDYNEPLHNNPFKKRTEADRYCDMLNTAHERLIQASNQ